ncbi:MAG: hypothetical protein QOC80_2758, partial [Frankiaceae bacterium]|nr:hypothetical protein [Frankiaceae bacterium]
MSAPTLSTATPPRRPAAAAAFPVAL